MYCLITLLDILDKIFINNLWSTESLLVFTLYNLTYITILIYSFAQLTQVLKSNYPQRYKEIKKNITIFFYCELFGYMSSIMIDLVFLIDENVVSFISNEGYFILLNAQFAIWGVYPVF